MIWKCYNTRLRKIHRYTALINRYKNALVKRQSQINPHLSRNCALPLALYFVDLPRYDLSVFMIWLTTKLMCCVVLWIVVIVMRFYCLKRKKRFKIGFWFLLIVKNSSFIAVITRLHSYFHFTSCIQSIDTYISFNTSCITKVNGFISYCNTKICLP